MYEPHIPEGLPVRRPGEPPLAGPHVILHQDGTVQTVYAGPNARKRRRDIRAGWVFAITGGGVVAGYNGWVPLGQYAVFVAVLLGGALAVSRYRRRQARG